jgi:3'-5' exoribonuclease 1
MNYIIFDLEATCWQEKHKHVSEIIEIGAVKIDNSKQIIDEFNAFIKPVLQPQLSEFCKNLTSIEQSDVDRAQRFPDVIENYKKWIAVEEKEYYLCSWGFYDKKQLITDSELHNIGTDWLNKHISVKHQHQILSNLSKSIGLGNALKHENLEFDGIPHRGIDDARNIAKIFLKYFELWKFE